VERNDLEIADRLDCSAGSVKKNQLFGRCRNSSKKIECRESGAEQIAKFKKNARLPETKDILNLLF